MINWCDYLPDLKGTLISVYEEKVKDNWETNLTQLKQQFLDTKKALIIIAVAIFFILLIAYFWK